MKKFWLILFYGFANHLPNSYTMLVGRICNRIRISICRHIFKECGKVSTINRNIYFGKGQDVVIGDYSGIGANCVIPNNIIIGKYVMMGPDVYCLQPDHKITVEDIKYLMSSATFLCSSFPYSQLIQSMNFWNASSRNVRLPM